MRGKIEIMFIDHLGKAANSSANIKTMAAAESHEVFSFHLPIFRSINNAAKNRELKFVLCEMVCGGGAA